MFPCSMHSVHPWSALPTARDRFRVFSPDLMRVLVALLLLLSTALAQEVGSALNGIWTGQTKGRNGEIQDVAFRFSSNGKSLSGKMYGETESLALADATFDGEHVYFRIPTEMNGGHSYIVFNGVLKEGQIQMTRTRELPP